MNVQLAASPVFYGRLSWRCSVVVTLETWRVRPELFSGMQHKPFAWLGLAGVIGGLVAVFTGWTAGRELRAVLGSSAFIAGLMIAGAASVFPIMLHSDAGAGRFPVRLSKRRRRARAGWLRWCGGRSRCWFLPSAISCSSTAITHAQGETFLQDTQRPY